MKTGKIKVDSDNLMPIIKKWLYSDKDIFLREVVANATDAISKFNKLVSIGGAEPDESERRVVIRTDKDAGTLSIEDNGIGMTADEVEKYIAQVAFSGAQDFIKKYEGTSGDGIIGHFGLGFYSVYMVSDMVEIETKSYTGEPAVHWESDGNKKYSIGESDKTTRGTLITLHIKEEEKEFLDESTIRGLLYKYCNFMPYPIYLNPDWSAADSDEAVVENADGEEVESTPKEDKTPKAVNNTSPLYLKRPSECTDEEYIEFYKTLFHDYDAPLFWVHLNVDYPFNLKGILYFPKQKGEIHVGQGEVKLYCNQVFIADNIKEVVPEFLMLLKGVIDIPDIPLNVSRSFLQNDRDVKKISKHITKKVADKINALFNTDRPALEKAWTDISPFIKFGCMREDDFFDAVKGSLLYKVVDGGYETVAELLPDSKGTIYYTTNETEQSQYIKLYKEENIKVVVLDHYIDKNFIDFVEYKQTDVKFKRVDSETPSVKEDDIDTSNVAKLIELYKAKLDERYTVNAQGIAGNMPVVILADENQRRMNEMYAQYKEIFGDRKIPDSYRLIINLNSDVIKRLPDMDEDKQGAVVDYTLQLANLVMKQLTAEEMDQFIAKSIELLQKI